MKEIRAEVEVTGGKTPLLRVKELGERFPESIALRNKEFGIWSEITYLDFWNNCTYLASALMNFGVNKGDKVAVHSENRPEWFISDLGIQATGAVTVGLYPTNPKSEVEYLLGHSETVILFAEDQEQVDKALAVRENLPSLKKIVYFDKKGMYKYDSEYLISYDEFLEIGKEKLETNIDDILHTIDNIADDEEKLEVKESKFKQFKKDFAQKNFDNQIVKNMWDLIDEFKISVKIIEDLLDGINSDIKDKVILNSKKDLLIYSYRVAGTVGLMMAKILKVNKKSSLKSAIDLGIAMQLTNISRDVIEDSKINRFYINKNFEEITSTIDLADTFYKNSFYSIKDIPISFRFSILVARRIYRKIGYNILNKKTFENYKNSGKIYVSNIEKSIETIFAIFDLIRLSLTSIKEDQIQHDHFLINEEINLDERI